MDGYLAKGQGYGMNDEAMVPRNVELSGEERKRD